MMLGILLWREKEPGKGQKAITLREGKVLHLPVLCAEVLRENRLPEALLRRRMLAAAKRLRRAGVKEIILSHGEGGEFLQRLGLEAVSTIPLRQIIAADWVGVELGKKGISGAAAQVAVAAPRLTGEVVRTVTELALRYRYVLLDVPQGTEEFGNRLRRQYGVSLLDGTGRKRDKAQALILFAPEERPAENPVVLRLWDPAVPLPGILLPPMLEERLPAGVDRGQMLSALLRGGALSPGQICLGTSVT